MTGELVATRDTLDELLDHCTEMQRKFVENLLETPDLVYAYTMAGGKATRNDVRRRCAYEMLVNVNVQNVLRFIRRERMERTLITSDWVLNKLVQVVERCMQGQQVLDADGNPTGEWKFDPKGAVAALNLLMKHLGLFEKDNRQRNDTDTEALRARLRQMGYEPPRIAGLEPPEVKSLPESNGEVK